MARARDDQAQRIEDIHRNREQLGAERRELQGSFDSMMVERHAMIDDLHSIVEASHKKRNLRRPA